MRWGRGRMLPPFFTPVPAAVGLPGQTGAGPQPWQGCSSGYSSTQVPRSPPSPNPSGKHSTPFLANPKHDPVVWGWESPTPTAPKLKPHGQQLQRLICSLKCLCNVNRSSSATADQEMLPSCLTQKKFSRAEGQQRGSEPEFC